MKNVRHSMAVVLFALFFISSPFSVSAETIELVTYFPAAGGDNGGDSQVRLSAGGE